MSADLALRSDDVNFAMAVLSRCWFCAESRDGAPVDFLIQKPFPERLRQILVADGVNEDLATVWIEVVEPTLSAPIRDDAVWVDRRAAFDGRRSSWGLCTEAVSDVLFDSRLFAEATFLSDEAGQANLDALQAAGAWLNRRFGTGNGANFARLAMAYDRLAEALTALPEEGDIFDLGAALGMQKPSLKGILGLVAANGHRSRTRTLIARPDAVNTNRVLLIEAARADAVKYRNKPARGDRQWSAAIAASIAQASGFSYGGTPSRHRQYSVMLDHAARRLKMNHAFIRRAERERRERLRGGVCDGIAADVVCWLDAYRAGRGRDLGKPIELTRRAIRGWHQLVERWVASQATTAEARRKEVMALQADPLAPFGDGQLFLDLASDDALPVWHDEDGEPNSDILLDYVAARERARSRLAPALRHIDPHRSPIFVDYGVSRWHLSSTDNGMDLRVWSDGDMRDAHFAAAGHSSRRFANELAEPSAMRMNGDPVPRADSLAAIITDRPCVAASAAVVTNGRLQCARDALAAIERDLMRVSTSEVRARIVARLPWRLVYNAPLEKRDIQERLIERLRATKGRGSLASLGFGVPGLRVLGVDLGVRNAAACAVIRVVGPREIAEVASRADVQPPGPDEKAFRPVVDGRRLAFRRLGPDSVAGHQNEASWAAIEETWTVRLPGEGHGEVRKPELREVEALDRIANSIGAGDAPRKSPRSIIALQEAAVALARRYLYRNNELAGIVAALREPSDSAAALAALDRLRRRAAAPGLIADEEASLLKQFGPGRGIDVFDSARLSVALEQLWSERDGIVRQVLATVRRLFMGKGDDRKWMGGLSLARIRALEGRYRLARAASMRPTPDRPDGSDAVAGVAYKSRRHLDGLRTERRRVIAHRIVGAALGGERPDGSSRAPCDLIVAKDLSSLVPSGASARSLNRLVRLMAAASVVVAVRESAELHGLLTYTVAATYTSQLDGIYGESGILGRHVPVKAFVRSPFWRKIVERATRRPTAPFSPLYVGLSQRWNPILMRWAEPDGSWELGSKGARLEQHDVANLTRCCCPAKWGHSLSGKMVAMWMPTTMPPSGSLLRRSLIEIGWGRGRGSRASPMVSQFRSA